MSLQIPGSTKHKELPPKIVKIHFLPAGTIKVLETKFTASKEKKNGEIFYFLHIKTLMTYEYNMQLHYLSIVDNVSQEILSKESGPFFCREMKKGGRTVRACYYFPSWDKR